LRAFAGPRREISSREEIEREAQLAAKRARWKVEMRGKEKLGRTRGGEECGAEYEYTTANTIGGTGTRYE